MVKKDKAPGNILMIANYQSDVGYAWWLMENFWCEIAINFYKKNQDCFLIYPEINSIPNDIKNSPIRIMKHDYSNRSIWSLIQFFLIIIRNNITYIYLTDRPYYDWTYLLMRIAGVRKIINHDHMPGERTHLPIYKKIFKKLIHFFGILSCDYYIGVSDFVKKRAVEIACVPPKKCSFVHNGIKLFPNKKTNYAHDEFDIPKEAKIVVTTGRATFYKGVDVLIKCAHTLIIEKDIKNLFFLHIGDGPDLHKFKDMAVELGLSDKFIFAGFRQDVPKILPSCDIGIQASLGEAFSLSIIEYLHAGLVTLAPSSCGNAEAIHDGINGMLFPPGDVSGIVNRILFILNNKELAQKIKEEAKISVFNHFKIQDCNKRFISLLENQIL